MSEQLSHRTVEVADGVTLHYVEAGSGKPLVIIPGWSMTAAGFKGQITALAQERRVIALDMRGHGESSKPRHGYRISRLAADLRAVIGALKLGGVDLLGHSMGCSVIWSYLDLFGDQGLGRLVLVDQAPVVTGKPGWSETERKTYGCMFPDLAGLADFYQAVVGAEGAEATAAVIAGLFSSSFPADKLRWFANEIVKLPRQHAADLLYESCLLDWRDVIQTIRRPALVVGARASIFSAESQEWIAEQIPGAELEIFAADEGGSHFMFYDNPTKFNALVEAFLA